MKFEELVEIVGDEPVFETGLLLVGQVDSKDVRRQLSRWVRAGRIYQLRRGLYALAPPFDLPVPKCGVVVIDTRRRKWKALRSGDGAVYAFQHPNSLRAWRELRG